MAFSLFSPDTDVTHSERCGQYNFAFFYRYMSFLYRLFNIAVLYQRGLRRSHSLFLRIPPQYCFFLFLHEDSRSTLLALCSEIADYTWSSSVKARTFAAQLHTFGRSQPTRICVKTSSSPSSLHHCTRQQPFGTQDHIATSTNRRDTFATCSTCFLSFSLLAFTPQWTVAWSSCCAMDWRWADMTFSSSGRA